MPKLSDPPGTLARMPDYQPFAHLTTPNADLYRAVMGAFVRAKRRFVVHLRPEDVHEELDADLTAVSDALGRLKDWGNLRADPDTSRVTTVEDFHRARFLYQLTPAGEAAEQALTDVRRGARQAWGAAGSGAHRHRHPAASAAGAGEADRTRSSQGASAAARVGRPVFGPRRQRAGLHGLVAAVDRPARRGHRRVPRLQGPADRLPRTVHQGPRDHGCGDRRTGQEHRRDRCRTAAGDGRGARGRGRGAWSGPANEKQEFERGFGLWRERWLGLRQWFVSEHQHPSQAKLLRARARAAIPALLQVVSALNERRAGRSDRSADFRTLARWFAQAPDEATMHRLWRAVFGLSSSRHLTVDADTLGEREEQPVPASTPWYDAPPLMISPQLRKTGSYERRGKPNKIVDRSRAAAGVEGTGGAAG